MCPRGVRLRHPSVAAGRRRGLTSVPGTVSLASVVVLAAQSCVACGLGVHMPAWYVHMEAARRTALRLQGGDVPAGFPVSVADAVELGEICHTWRNYLA